MTSSLFAFARTCGLPVLLAAAIALAPAADAQSRRSIVIRDAEIEALLRDYAAPIFGAAGIAESDTQIVLIQDRTFNAFVASGHRIFMHTGTLLDAESPNEVIGVLAHETGHLVGGHLENLHNEIARAQAIGMVISALGIAGVAAGAVTGSAEGAQMGSAALSMAPGVALRGLLSYKRAQETSADRAALSFLKASHQSAKGMITTFERFADQQLFSAQYADPYAQTHPMARDRLEQLETTARASPYWDAVDDAGLQLRHDMMRAKLSAFTEAPSTVGRRYPRSDTSLPAQYARAIVAYRSGGLRGAIRAIDQLIARVPNYAYFYELKGQALFEAGKAREAIAPLKQAVALAPHPGLLRIMLGGAEVSTGDGALLDDAIANLRRGLAEEPLASVGYRHLAIAYQRQGKVADALLATAEGALIDGNVEGAKGYAKRAQAGFANGSPGWLKADDIISYQSPTASIQ